MAVGTVTIVEKPRPGGIGTIKFTWTSTSAGLASDETTYVYNAQILSAYFNPSATPTAAYDVTVTDADGNDVLGGQGADLSATVRGIKTQKDGLASVCSSKLTLNVTNGGDAMGGIVYLHLLDLS
jgi:hypothetical protein